MLTIWGRTNSVNVQKVMWAVGELGLAHRRIDAGGAFGGLDTPDYGAMNPNRKIPVLQDGETVVWESNACVRYLAACYGKGGLWPEDPAQRARADAWMDWMITTVLPDLGICFWGLVRTPEAQRDMAAIEAAAGRLGPLWQILDEWLSERRFVAGPELTMGDIPVGCAFYRYMNLDIERPGLPNLQLWYQNLKARDAYRQHVMIPVT
ncbi:glutathione S-transferase family protein [Marinimicrococcus flavescens]|uniref:Glutathione S-transferase n=1 Tax=Marinimicrococcus flavescens TaxID=3031815 RepID=A0AAP3XRA9_9PROT|nr:glutathione S-transferase [Marinimicrococcus flavescens]